MRQTNNDLHQVVSTRPHTSTSGVAFMNCRAIPLRCKSNEKDFARAVMMDVVVATHDDVVVATHPEIKILASDFVPPGHSLPSDLVF